jgi:glycosyltransferase involved in cell wall biosynthesis
MSKIRVLAISPDNHGIGKYRILDPYKYIGENFSEEVHVDITFDADNSDEVFKNYDVVVFNGFIHKAPHEETINRIQWLKSQGIKVVVDTDDYWKLDTNHPSYHLSVRNKVAQKLLEILKLADHITTTTPVYANKIRESIGAKGKNIVHVFPNAVDENEKQFRPAPTNSDRMRFGWVGGSTHLRDLKLLTSGIQLINQTHKDKVQFVLCGFDTNGKEHAFDRNGNLTSKDLAPTETSWYKYEKIFTDNFSSVDEKYRKFLHRFLKEDYSEQDVQYVRRWSQSINSYATHYNHFDVALAPLHDNEFNSYKSQLKVIEAGFHKKPIIASETAPYLIDLTSAVKGGFRQSDGNALLVGENKDHKLWGQHMKRLIDNPNLAEDLGNRLYETVKDKYSLKNVSKNRVEFLKSII